MTPSARLGALIEMLTEIQTTPRPADAIVSAYFRARRYIGSKDRAALSTQIYALLRARARINWWLETNGAQTTPRMMALAGTCLLEKLDLDALSKLCSGGKFAPEVIAPDERKWLRAIERHTIDHPSMPPEVAHECPDWALPSMQARFGKNFGDELDAMLDSAPLDLRINPLKTTRDAVVKELTAAGFSVEICAYSPYGLRLLQRPDLNRIPHLRAGKVEIQDEGSQLVALLLGAKPGERVVDFCAGAGGKTLAIAAEMQNKGRIYACDVLAARLKRSQERFRRAGFHNIEIKALTSERDPWVKKHKGTFDRVLVDAPCSGSGTWRRNPDQRWKNLGPGLDELTQIQSSILDSAARLVKPGGHLVYATCSMLAEENERQIENFLAFHADFRLVPLDQPENKPCPSWPSTGPMMSLTPNQHHTDGFFAALLQHTIKE